MTLWKKDFQDFQNLPATSVSENDISCPQDLLAQINRDLLPTSQSVLLKLTLVHLFSSLATLTICPQFGFRLLGTGHGVMNYFMPLGSFACFFLCGVLYFGSTVLAAAFIFSRPEWRVFYAKFLPFSLGLTLVSLMVFTAIAQSFFISLSLLWLAGCLIAGYIFLKFANVLKLPRITHA